MFQSSRQKDRGYRPNPRLALILALYLVLAVAYSVVVPIGRGADEWAHYWYAQFIARQRRLPANPAEREAAGYKSDWPPLYHILAAGLTAWIETDGPPTFKYRADSIRRQLAPVQGPEAILHTEDERFPWQQEILVWHLGRFLSIAFSALTLLLTYLIARQVFEHDGSRQSGAAAKPQGAGPTTPISYSALSLPSLLCAVVSIAILAFTPRFLFTGMLFNYDSLTLLLSSLFLWLSIRLVNGNGLRWGFFALGFLVGLALITKYLAAPLLIIIVLVAWWSSTGAESIDQTTHYALRSTLYKLLKSALIFLLVSGWWFAYLLINFNEIDAYGPVLGSLAPLLRGDGSDRTVEQLFSLISSGQVPPPAVVERQSYSAGQILSSFFTTFWGNAVTRPYPLHWFIVVMGLIMLLAVIGLGLSWRRFNAHTRRLISLLVLICLLPVPFMLVRLYGARDALEAVQGRHILFLAAPAVAVLLVIGLGEIVRRAANIGKLPVSVLLRLTFSTLVSLLLLAAVLQLLVMYAAYPPVLPVRTLPYQARTELPNPIQLGGGAELLEVTLQHEVEELLQVEMIWQAGQNFAPEDYRVEIALLNATGETVSGWQAYQTQARYPTRMWEPGDIIRDTGWLPLANLPAGEYQLQVRVVDAAGLPSEWHRLEPLSLAAIPADSTITVWQQGQAASLPRFAERETILITAPDRNLETGLAGPQGLLAAPIAAGTGWANFIVEPHWPPGIYTLENGQPLFSIAESGRDFKLPDITHPLDVNFAGKIRLLGYDLPVRRIEPGQKLPVVLTWQALDWLAEEFVLFDRLLDNQGLVWGGYDRLALENYSTLLWAPGEIIADGFAIPVDPDTPAGVYTITLGWYREVDGQAESLPIIDPATNQPGTQTAVTLGPIKIGGPPAGVTVKNAEPQLAVNQTLGQTINLLGYDLAMDDTSQMILTFYWQALASPELDYTVFAHIRDDSGQIVAQQDQPPLAGVYPTSLWEKDEIIKDVLTIPLAGLPSGQYEVVVGMYDRQTGERLPSAAAADGMILLQEIEVGQSTD